MAQRPGVMFYFDLRPCLKRLTLEEKGRLFESILNYAELGEVPELEGMCGVAWDFIQPRIDRDGEAYNRSILQKLYAAYCREQKRTGGTPLPFDQWEVLSDTTRERMITDDNEPLPTTTSPTDTSLSTTPTISSKAKEKADAERGVGRGEQLSAEDLERRKQEQIARLLDQS